MSATPRITSSSTLAALLAIGAAAITGVVLAERAFSMSLDLPQPTLLGGGALGMALAMSADWLGTRRIVCTPPGMLCGRVSARAGSTSGWVRKGRQELKRKPQANGVRKVRKGRKGRKGRKKMK